jgi:hypothetical protein
MVSNPKDRESPADVCPGGRSELSVEGLRRNFREHLFYTR